MHIAKPLSASIALVCLTADVHAAPYEAYTSTSAGGSYSVIGSGSGTISTQNTESGVVTTGTASSQANGVGSFHRVVESEPAPTVYYGDFQSSSMATAAGGILRASADGSATSSASDGSQIPSSANSRATAHFLDTITIMSDSLPIGAPVTLGVTSHLSLVATPSYSILPAGYPNAGTELAYTGRIFDADFAIPFTHNVGGTGIEVSSGTYEQVGTINVKVGDAIQVEGALHVFGSSVDGTYAIDASNTAAIVLTPLDTFTLSSASGASYSTIPEPASLGLLAVGATLMLRRRR